MRRWFTAIFLSVLSFSLLADPNPFAKKIKVNIGADAAWKIDQGVASKTASDSRGRYYHLQFDKQRLRLLITNDAAGQSPRHYTSFGVQDIQVDGKTLPLFRWCLNNQERHHRFLQQGLAVKRSVCEIDGDQGVVTLHLNRATLTALENGKRLVWLIKPYRTPVKLNYELTDFADMVAALTVKKAPPVAATTAVEKISKPSKCWAGAPAKYKHIRPVEYACGDAGAKAAAESRIVALIEREKEKARKAAEAKRKKREAQARKQRELEAQRKKQEEARRKQQEAEAAELAASETKASALSSEITVKMVGMCRKFWDKGQHRCYCQKYIDFAPAVIKAKAKAGDSCKK